MDLVFFTTSSHKATKGFVGASGFVRSGYAKSYAATSGLRPDKHFLYSAAIYFIGFIIWLF